MNHVLDGGPDPHTRMGPLAIMYLTPFEQWTCLVFAPTGHNALHAAGGGVRPCAGITLATC